MRDPYQGTVAVEVAETDSGRAVIIHVSTDEGAAHLLTRDPHLALSLAARIIHAARELERAQAREASGA